MIALLWTLWVAFVTWWIFYRLWMLWTAFVIYRKPGERRS